MKTRSLLALLLAALLPVALAAPSQAITDGTSDGDDHPFVGLMIAQDENGDPLWRCTGTLLDDGHFLTAGHCTESPAAHVEIWFATGPIPLDANYAGDCADVTTGGGLTGYPCVGDVGGTPYTHPDYDPNAFYLFDLGMVVLDEPYQASEYGTLPSLGQLDSLKKGMKKGARFDSVGYGLQRSSPSGNDLASRERLIAHPKLIQINNRYVGDYAIILSNNARTGGTCFGDSGGPNFLAGTNVIAGVTSFGKNPTCGGQGGVYRVDQADDLEWIASFYN